MRVRYAAVLLALLAALSFLASPRLGQTATTLNLSTQGHNMDQVAYGQVNGTPTLYNQTLQVGARAQTQRAIVNFAAGTNVTIAPTDNGLNTTTLTVSGTGLQAPANVNSIVKYTSGTSTMRRRPPMSSPHWGSLRRMQTV
jgi:hypothetical protein